VWCGHGGEERDVLEEDSLRNARGVCVMLLRAVVEREILAGRRALVAVLKRARADMLCCVVLCGCACLGAK
jgi:hypothetical protein